MTRPVLPALALVALALACTPAQEASAGSAADAGSGGGATGAAGGSANSGSQPESSGSSGGGSTNGGTSGPEVLYERPARPRTALEVDATHIYWNEAAADDLRFMMAPKDGNGPVEVLGEWSGSDIQIKPLASDSESIYWRYDTKIIRMGKGTRALTEIDVGHAWGDLLVDDKVLYTSDRYCAAMTLVDKETLEKAVVTIPNGGQDPGGYTGMTMDEDDVICSHGEFVHAVSKKDRAVRDLVQDQEEADMFGPVASDGETLFWLSFPRILGTGTESLHRRRKAGGSVETLAVIGRNAGYLRLDTAREWLYTVSNSSGNGIPVLGYSLAAQKLNEIATDQLPTFAITFDSNYIYWSVTDGFESAGSIVRMKAPEAN